MSEDAQAKRLMAARARLADTHPYITRALFAISSHAIPGLGTVAVDSRWRLAYDPGILEMWSVPQIAGVLYHEVLHLLRDHAGRAGARHPVAWNVACDAEINDDLRDESFLRWEGGQQRQERIELPGSPIFPETLNQAPHLTAEEYYRSIPHESGQGYRRRGGGQPSVGSGQCGSGATGVPEAWEAQISGASPGQLDTPQSGEAQISGASPGQLDTPQSGEGMAAGNDVGVSPGEADVIRRLVAQEVNKSQGTIPGHIARFAERELEPARIDWRRELRSIVARTVTTVSGAVDYSYTRPSRRQSAVAGVVLPALREPVVRVAAVVDTSGSMGDQELTAALAQIDAILRSVGARDGLVVFAVDAKVHTIKQVFRAADVQLVGGGGTDMRIGINAAVKLRPRPDIVIVLTDGYTPWPNYQPRGIRVIVGLIGNARHTVPEWMQVVHIA